MKIVEIDIKNENDLFEKYSKTNISKELINYLVLNTSKHRKNDKFKIIINNYTNIEAYELLIKGLKDNYEKSLDRYIYNNKIQII